jgi:hypothetical protein
MRATGFQAMTDDAPRRQWRPFRRHGTAGQVAERALDLAWAVGALQAADPVAFGRLPDPVRAGFGTFLLAAEAAGSVDHGALNSALRQATGREPSPTADERREQAQREAVTAAARSLGVDPDDAWDLVDPDDLTGDGDLVNARNAVQQLIHKYPGIADRDGVNTALRRAAGRVPALAPTPPDNQNAGAGGGATGRLLPAERDPNDALRAAVGRLRER